MLQTSFIGNLLVFIIAMGMVVKGATMATKYSALLAESYRLSKYMVGFLVVAVISILPETVVSLSAVAEGIPSFGLGTLFGSNIADLTLVFALIIFANNRGLKVESRVLKNHVAYPFLLVLPLILGSDGFFSRQEGAALVLVGAVYYYIALKNGIDKTIPAYDGNDRHKHFAKLLFSMAVLVAGAYATVDSAVTMAGHFGINPVLIGMLVVGIGTTMPEMFFSLKSIKRKDDSLAIGDLLGTVLADATVVVGILALVSPFSFPLAIIYISGFFMVAAAFLLFKFMNSGHYLSRKEAMFLLAYWAVFVLVEYLGNT